MISFEEAIEIAKDELGVDGWTDDWKEVSDLAKEIYWKNDEFKLEKAFCLEEANDKCEICESNNCLTIHHIYYNKSNNFAEEGKTVICVCSVCQDKLTIRRESEKRERRKGLVKRLENIELVSDL